MAINAEIFMCAHSSVPVLPPLCTCVQGGARLNPPLPGALPDYGEGGGISEKNPAYCELTVQYFAWKNKDLDAYGFCHYRRLFSFNEDIKKPYVTLGKIPKGKGEYYLGSEEKIRKTIEENPVIVPRCEDVGMSVYEKYISSAHHHREDIDLFLKLIKEHYPYLSPYADEYMSQNKQYFCNMFIMEKKLFYEYSSALFTLLEAFDKLKKPHGVFQADRVDGYLGERFLGIYIHYLKSKGIRIHHVARIDIDCSLGKRIVNWLLPPETKRRFFFKRIFK